jgi:hypothetical protein
MSLLDPFEDTEMSKHSSFKFWLGQLKEVQVYGQKFPHRACMHLVYPVRGFWAAWPGLNYV